MVVTLTVVGGVHNGRVIPVAGPEFRIGRDPRCNLRPSSEDISRRHCAILVRQNGQVFLKDYGSRNGTVLNHRVLVHGEMQLENGDVLEIGPLTFKVNIAPGQPPQKPSSKAGGEDIHEDDIMKILMEGQEPSGEETIQVSRPRLVAPSQPMKDAPPRMVRE